jgi:hypothetical protein
MAALTNIGPQTGTIAMNEEETVEGENHLIDQRINVTGIEDVELQDAAIYCV